MVQEYCLATTSKGMQCSKRCAYGQLTCNIKSHIDQINNVIQNGGSWGSNKNPIYSLKQNNKKFVQMGGWGEEKFTLFGFLNKK